MASRSWCLGVGATDTCFRSLCTALWSAILESCTLVVGQQNCLLQTKMAFLVISFLQTVSSLSHISTGCKGVSPRC